MNPKISYIEISGRDSYPTLGRTLKDSSPLHLWEPTLRTLAKQDFKDFEVIIVDYFFNERKEYFKNHNHGIKIKHVPAKPSPWSEKLMCQSCNQFNTGIIHADGELLFFGADSGMYPPRLMGNLWKHYLDGKFVSLGFGEDYTFSKDKKVEHQPGFNWVHELGYEGKVEMDLRYRTLFGNNDLQEAEIEPGWFYGISTASLKATLEINGFGEFFDPDLTEADIDFGERLKMAGYNKIVMCRDCYTVEALANPGWHAGMVKAKVKCTPALLKYNKLQAKSSANTPFTEIDVKWLLANICRKDCPYDGRCKELQTDGPFYNPRQIELYKHWLNAASKNNLNLAFEREMRINGEDHAEGSFYNH